MTLLCGAGLAVPLDKELPVNEIENLIKRSRATAVIYSEKKKDEIDKVKDSVPMVKYFIKMDSYDKVKGRDVGLMKYYYKVKRWLKREIILSVR